MLQPPMMKIASQCGPHLNIFGCAHKLFRPTSRMTYAAYAQLALWKWLDAIFRPSGLLGVVCLGYDLIGLMCICSQFFKDHEWINGGCYFLFLLLEMTFLCQLSHPVSIFLLSIIILCNTMHVQQKNVLHFFLPWRLSVDGKRFHEIHPISWPIFTHNFECFAMSYTAWPICDD